jgi:phospholipid/cholesterol/gamma-HCH transport system ATP-binding protein
MVRIENLTIRLGNVTILEDITLNVKEGTVLTIIGGSGCGKSTLLRAVMRLIPIAAGEIWIDDREVSRLPENAMNEVRKTMGMVFQEGALFDSMSVFENVAFPLRRHTRKPEKEIRALVCERLEAVDMLGAENKLPSQLSGGMRRRVGIARALALSPKLLLYDEPTTGLDPVLTATVVELILKMRARYGNTSIIVTHDMGAARRVSDHIAMIHDGHVIEQGSFDALQSSANPYVREFMHSGE